MECTRCGKDSTISTRGEKFCEDCFVDFLNRKIRPQLTHFRVNGSPDSKTVSPLIVVPINFRAASLALVDMLVNMRKLQMQKHKQMDGFRILCLYIGDLSDDVSWPWPEVDFEQIELNVSSIEQPIGIDSDTLTRSSKQDLEKIMTRQMILAYAKKHEAFTAFAYSMTKLSEITLAETVKGRGANLPALVTPDLMLDKVVYPLRDITSSELEKYCKITGLNKYIIPDAPVPSVTKRQSIDEIVHLYFTKVQEEFPSVVSTVSKISSRLSQTGEECGLCQPRYIGKSVKLCYACASIAKETEMKRKLDILDMYEL